MTLQTAYREIGRAVLDVQIFELTFLPVVELLRVVKVDGHYEKHQGEMRRKAWRDPVTNHVRDFLEPHALISLQFAGRIRTFSEKRHTLIHRWAAENGLPHEAAGDDDYAPMIQLAQEVSHEARELTALITRYVIAAMTPAGDCPVVDLHRIFVDDAELDAANKVRMAQMHEQMNAERGMALSQFPARIVEVWAAGSGGPTAPPPTTE